MSLSLHISLHSHLISLYFSSSPPLDPSIYCLHCYLSLSLYLSFFLPFPSPRSVSVSQMSLFLCMSPSPHLSYIHRSFVIFLYVPHLSHYLSLLPLSISLSPSLSFLPPISLYLSLPLSIFSIQFPLIPSLSPSPYLFLPLPHPHQLCIYILVRASNNNTTI